MLAAIRKFFRPPTALTRQRGRDCANQDDSDLEASIDASQQQLDDISQQQQQQQAGDEHQHGRRPKGQKDSRWQKQAAKLDRKRDRGQTAKEAGGQVSNKIRGPACGGLGDSGSDSSSSGSSSTSDTTSSSSNSSSSNSSGSAISGNNSELNNTASNSVIRDEARLLHAAAAAAASSGEGQLATGVAECGDCPQHQQQHLHLTGHHDANESNNPTWEQLQAQARAHKSMTGGGGKDFNLDYDDEGGEAADNEVDNEEEEEEGDDDDNFTAEDQNRVAFIAEVGNANTNRQYHHHHHSQGATSLTSSLQVNATPTMMPPFSSGAPFQASATPGTVSSTRKTDVDQLLTGATSVANQRRDSVRGNLEELRVAESVNYRPVVYKYSFKIPDTPANMRVFTDPDDRRIEAIARSCDSQIHLEKLPVRPGGISGQSTLKMRKITIQSPDLHSLEKCCRQFDDRFKHFYVSGGLGLSGKSIQRVYVDELDNN